jgi:hypothetical protein
LSRHLPAIRKERCVERGSMSAYGHLLSEGRSADELGDALQTVW